MANLCGRIILGLVLGVAAYRDWKERQIPVSLPMAAAAAGVLLQLLYQQNTVKDILLGVAVGVVISIISWFSQGAIGLGDGIMLIVSGIYLGFWKNVEVLFYALTCVGAAALFMLVIMKRERKYRIPFLPFLMFAYILQLMTEM